jgi:hypothetical protein
MVRQIMGFSLQRKICTKSEDLKFYWEDRLDTSLPDGAEVWNKPNLDEEYYKESSAGSSTDPDESGGIGPSKSVED